MQFLKDRVCSKNWMIILPIILILILTPFIVYLYNYSPEKKDLITALIAAVVYLFGLIFVGLKFKLDRASFEMDLFEKRYKIFNIFNEVIYRWSNKSKVMEKEELENTLSGSVINRSYFLFGEKTYNELIKIRQYLIDTNDARKENKTMRITDQKIKEAEEYLNKLIGGEKLFKVFPELKVDF